MTKVKTKMTINRRYNSASDKIWSVGLASATCISLVGVLALQEVKARESADGANAVSEADYDALRMYEESLAAQAAALAEYRAELEAAAKIIQGSVAKKMNTGSAVAAPESPPKVEIGRTPMGSKNTAPKNTAPKNAGGARTATPAAEAPATQESVAATQETKPAPTPAPAPQLVEKPTPPPQATTKAS